MEEKMLSDVKNYLDITFEDEENDKKITGMIQRGTSYLNNIAGISLDFLEENTPKSLLLDYCRYARSNNLEFFNTNFKQELIMLRLGVGAKEHEERKN